MRELVRRSWIVTAELFWAVLLGFLVLGGEVSAFLATGTVFAASAGIAVLGSTIVFGGPRNLGEGVELFRSALVIAVSAIVLEQHGLEWRAWSGLAGCVLLGLLPCGSRTPRRGSPFEMEAERITFLAIAWLGFAVRGGGAALAVPLPVLQGLEVLVRNGCGVRTRSLRARVCQQTALALALGCLAPGLSSVAAGSLAIGAVVMLAFAWIADCLPRWSWNRDGRR